MQNNSKKLHDPHNKDKLTYCDDVRPERILVALKKLKTLEEYAGLANNQW
jgi:hypothetical protein